MDKKTNGIKSPANLKGIMPDASEMWGIYQPLRRWKFRMIGNRFGKFRNAIYPKLAEQAWSSQHAPLQRQLNRQTGAKSAADNGRQAPTISDPKPMAFINKAHPPLTPDIDCGIARLLQRDLGSTPPRDWGSLITTASMTTRLEKLKAIVAKPDELRNFPDIADYVQSFGQAIRSSDHTLVVQSLFEKEARIAGFLLFLARHKPSQLNEIFFTESLAANRPALDRRG
jgi:hypothetical protein